MYSFLNIIDWKLCVFACFALCFTIMLRLHYNPMWIYIDLIEFYEFYINNQDPFNPSTYNYLIKCQQHEISFNFIMIVILMPMLICSNMSLWNSSFFSPNIIYIFLYKQQTIHSCVPVWSIVISFGSITSSFILPISNQHFGHGRK